MMELFSDIYLHSFMPAGNYCNRLYGEAFNRNSNESWWMDPTSYTTRPKGYGDLNKVSRHLTVTYCHTFYSKTMAVTQHLQHPLFQAPLFQQCNILW